MLVTRGPTVSHTVPLGHASISGTHGGPRIASGRHWSPGDPREMQFVTGEPEASDAGHGGTHSRLCRSPANPWQATLVLRVMLVTRGTAAGDTAPWRLKAGDPGSWGPTMGHPQSPAGVGGQKEGKRIPNGLDILFPRIRYYWWGPQVQPFLITQPSLLSVRREINSNRLAKVAPFLICTSSCAIAVVLRKRTPEYWASGICLSLGLPFTSYVPLDR